MRKIGLVLVVLGAFMVVSAPLLRFYAYPKLAVAPTAQSNVSTLVGPHATIFDVGTLKNVTTNLTTHVVTLGDTAAAAKAPGKTVVWVSKSSTTDSAGTVVSRSIDRYAFNAFTAEAVNCCGEYYSSVQGQNTPIKHEGLLVKFPFNTKKQTYDFWDGTLEKARPISYIGSTKIQGLTVYIFHQVIPPTQVGTEDAPRSILGLSGSGNVKAASMYGVNRTLWVEPVTGVIIKRAESQNSYLAVNGQNLLTTTQVTTGYNAATVSQNVKDYKGKASQLTLLRSTLPLILLIVGLIALILGLLVTIRRPAPEARHA